MPRDNMVLEGAAMAEGSAAASFWETRAWASGARAGGCVGRGRRGRGLGVGRRLGVDVGRGAGVLDAAWCRLGARQGARSPFLRLGA